MPLHASTGPVLVRCWQHRPSTGPVLAHNCSICPSPPQVTTRITLLFPFPDMQIIPNTFCTYSYIYRLEQTAGDYEFYEFSFLVDIVVLGISQSETS